MADHLVPTHDPTGRPAGPTLVCADCGNDYHWTESPSLERCRGCAAIRAEFLGIAEEDA